MIAYLVVFLAYITYAHATAVTSFNNFIQGNWTVASGVATASEYKYDDVIIQARFSTENTTSSVLGSALFNNTVAASNESENSVEKTVSLKFDFLAENPNKGTAFSVTDSKLVPLFDFDFIPTNNSFFISSGEWAAESSSSYTFTIADNDRFVLTIATPTDSKSYFGTRIPDIPEKTFWEKYSTWILMAGMLIVNSYMQRMMKPKEAQDAPQAQPVTTEKKNN